MRDAQPPSATAPARPDGGETRVAETLPLSAERLVDIIDFLPDATMVVDRAGTVVVWNRAMEALTGCPARDVIGRGDHAYALAFYGERQPMLVDVVLGDASAEALYPDLRREGDAVMADIVLRSVDGSVTYQWARAQPLRNAEGEVVGAIEAVRDVTELRRAEQVLHEKQMVLAAIAGSARDAIIMMDPAGAICFWNKAAEAIFGCPPEEVLGKELHALLVPERFREAYRRGLAHFQQSGDGPAIGRTLELVARRKGGGEFPVELSLSAVRLPAGWHAVGVIRDITERKRAEQALAEANHRLEELATTDDLTGLWNRRHFHDMLDRECHRTARSHLPLAVAMVDIDHFKAVNDRHGHPFGDRVLVEVARTMRETARVTDLVARYGGEEFMVLLPETGTNAASDAAERLRRAVADRPVSKGDLTVAVTVSIGVAAWEGEADPTVLLRHVDEALYAAKEAGRNRTMVWTAEGPRPAASASPPA